jgi:hypothetical protein
MVAAREQEVLRDESVREGDFGSAEWVEFEEQQATGKITVGPATRQTSSVTITEVELRNRIEKLNATVTEVDNCL